MPTRLKCCRPTICRRLLPKGPISNVVAPQLLKRAKTEKTKHESKARIQAIVPRRRWTSGRLDAWSSQSLELHAAEQPGDMQLSILHRLQRCSSSTDSIHAQNYNATKPRITPPCGVRSPARRRLHPYVQFRPQVLPLTAARNRKSREPRRLGRSALKTLESNWIWLLLLLLFFFFFFNLVVLLLLQVGHLNALREFRTLVEN